MRYSIVVIYWIDILTRICTIAEIVIVNRTRFQQINIHFNIILITEFQISEFLSVLNIVL